MIRHLYGGTNRPHHLKLSRHIALASTLGLLLYTGSPLAFVVGIGCWAHEGWASSDRDLEENRKHPSWYWLPYGRMVRHRSVWSHGLLIGTIVRLAYGWWWLLWPLHAVAPAVVGAFCLGALLADLAHLALDA